MNPSPAREKLDADTPGRPAVRQRRPRPQPEGTLAYYEDNAGPYCDSTRPLGMEEQLERFAIGMRPGGTVLDLGCGSGRDLVALAEAGFTPTGLDISPRLAAMAREHSGCPVLIGDMRNPPLENVTFDGIWAAASLLHLHRSELPAVLDRMRRLLVPRGRLFASVKAGSGEERTGDGRWFTYFQPEEWRDLLAASGFNEIEIGHDIGEVGRVRSSDGWIQSFAYAS